ncbi:riboflavin synthase [Fastidiosibacter lacustris]|uniref:riboflavin synthase n=1 Tax=Fastidiosibacter lacustris TaxID=2056695 RepID=UPI000E35050F|nr:riboflavin synthase [Fastidiosibacter lacustris]
MFSGIVQEVATVVSIGGKDVISIEVSFKRANECKIGDSIAINGVCLTVVNINLNYGNVKFEVVPETLRKTNLGMLKVDDSVNLELSLRLSDFVGGHMVQGHVDGVGVIKSINHEGDAWLVAISAPEVILQYLVSKGFVTIDGMSITIIEVSKDHFIVTFIPHTIKVTVVKNYKVGTNVNLEADPIGKHIHHYMEKIRDIRAN